MDAAMLCGLLWLAAVAHGALDLRVPSGTGPELSLRVEPWGANSIRVRLSPSGQIYDGLPGALGSSPEEHAGHGGATSDEAETATSVTSGNLQAVVSPEGELTFTNVDSGQVLLRQLGPVTSGPSLVNASFAAMNISFHGSPEEVLVGFGQRSKTQTSLNNKVATPVVQLSQAKYYISIPFGVSSRGYGFLWNLPGDGSLTMDPNATHWSATTTKQLDFWVTTHPPLLPEEDGSGDAPVLPLAAIMAQYADATGHAPMLPEHAAGFWQSKDRYSTEDEVLEVARGYAERSLPLGFLVVDFHSWVYFGDYTFNPKCWPSPATMVKDLGVRETKVLLSTYPYFDIRSNNTAAGLAHGFFARNVSGLQAPIVKNDNCGIVPSSGDENGRCFLIDPFNQGARAWVWAHHQHYVDAGIESFWLDDTEPGGGAAEGGKPALSGMTYACGPAEYCGALWPNAWVSIFSEGVVSRGIDEPVMLARAGWAGFQKLGAVLWSSDIESTFAVLRVQVRAGLATAMSGVPYWTTDVGGFSRGEDTAPEMRELIVRWHQYGAFCPIYRTHGDRLPECTSSQDPHDCNYACGGAGNEAWSYGPEAEAGISAMIRLRHTLLPYTLELAAATTERGEPPMRPLLYDFPLEPSAWTVDDQFMYGPKYLVAPVLEYGARQRSVWFPPGEWRHLFTNETVRGPSTHIIAAPLLEFPVYERLG